MSLKRFRLNLSCVYCILFHSKLNQRYYFENATRTLQSRVATCLKFKFLSKASLVWFTFNLIYGFQLKLSSGLQFRVWFTDLWMRPFFKCKYEPWLSDRTEKIYCIFRISWISPFNKLLQLIWIFTKAFLWYLVLLFGGPEVWVAELKYAHNLFGIMKLRHLRKLGFSSNIWHSNFYKCRSRVKTVGLYILYLWAYW